LKSQYARGSAAYAAALVSILAAYIFVWRSEALYYRRGLENAYQQDFYTLVESIEKINVAMQKVQYANSPTMLNFIWDEVAAQSAVASTALSGLPSGDAYLINTERFLSQVGDYSIVLARTSAGGSVIGEEERNNLRMLSDSAYQLSYGLTDTYRQLTTGELKIIDSSDVARSNSSGAGSVAGVAQTLGNIETGFAEYAGLIYDGPFSENVNMKDPILLKNKSEVLPAEALKAAADMFGVDPTVLTLDGEGGGRIPVYCFSALVNGGNFSADVTKIGGFVQRMSNSRAIGTAALSNDSCLKAAENFLSSSGFKNMRSTGYTITGDILTYSFAYCTDGIKYYTDLIKVSFAKDDGGIVGFVCTEYITSHTTRNLPSVKISREDAEAAISDGIKVTDYSLAVIPSGGKNELFCHEFLCTDSSGQKYLVYVNTTTGMEENILVVVDSDNGVLTF
jgi:germination protein YpeB